MLQGIHALEKDRSLLLKIEPSALGKEHFVLKKRRFPAGEGYGLRSNASIIGSATKQTRQMLAEIYNWFTEGFDTKEMQEAKALTEELSH
jgi:hypothetical protein